ncbi:hypothetical protein [Providencia phage PSTRCR_121]|nr:hypothetical protein [Providencia phage PSTRCR_121]
MADLTRIQFKRSKTPNVRPAPDTVAEGEIVLNLADRAILTKLGNEIIDLGFAKGGKVDGNIDLTGNFTQTNGHFNTTGSITAGAESSFTDINVLNSIKLKSKTTEDFGSITFYDGKFYFEQYINGKWTGQLGIPQGAGTIASREWTNTMIKDLGSGVSMSSPRGTTEIANNDDGNMGFWDRTTKRWVFVVGAQSGANFAGGYVRIKNALSGGDQSSFEATSPDGGKKIGLWAYNDGRTLLSAYDGGAWSNITIGGVGNGTIALREWVSNLNQTYNETMNLKAGSGSSSPITLRNWGSGDRKNVFEVGDNLSYFFYAQRKGNNTIEFNVNGPILTNGQSVATQQWVQNNAGGMATINVVYPVGVVMWFAQNKNPNSLFPGTKWVYVGENKTIRLANSNGSNVMSSGGNDNVALSAGHMPSHTHSFSGTTSWFDYGSKGTSGGGAHDHGVPYSVGHNNNLHIANIDQSSFKGESKPLSLNGLRNVEYKLRTDSNGNHSHSVAIGGHNHTISGTTGGAGSGSAFSVVNSYVMLMAWYRES